jgi:predicted enzyme related to lactoylglutathione lyase
MSTVTKYEPGTPCWVELATPDLDAAKPFYTALFGWDYAVGPEETAFYTMPQLAGQNVAGMMTQGEDEKAQGVPPMWRTYVSVKSADETMKKVAGLGGTVLMEPFDVMDVGRMAAFLDTENAMLAVWQPKEHVGAGIVNETGTFGWSELTTRDPDGAKKFYSGLFGWGTEDHPDYYEWQVNDRAVGGMLPMTPEMGDMPPCWTTYFMVDDTDAIAKTVKAEGGAVFVEPRDIPDVGRFAVVADPQGAMFAIIKMAEGHETSPS